MPRNMLIRHHCRFSPQAPGLRKSSSLIISSTAKQLCRPEVKTWQDLSEGLPIEYTPSGTNIKMILGPVEHADILSPDMVYNATVSGLADVVNTTIAGKGSLAFGVIQEKVGQFDKNYPPSLLNFILASDETQKNVANLQTVADVLKGIQELTHLVFLPELEFGISYLNDPANLIASGCFAYDCTHITASGRPGYSIGTTTNSTSLPKSAIDRRQTYVLGDFAQGINITISDDSNSKEIKGPNYADVSTQMLWEMIPMLVKAGGDSSLPHDEEHNRPGWHVSDTVWRSQFTLNFWQPVDTQSPYTLGRVAKTLSYVQQSFDKTSLVESRMVVRVPIEDAQGSVWQVSGIGCMSYASSNSQICRLDTPAVEATSQTQPQSGGPSATPPASL